MEDNDLETVAPQGGIGAQLKATREQRGLTLEQVAAATRIPQRHLVKMEAGDFAGLPGRTYAIGFSRTYAKLLELDQDDVTALVRAELDAQDEDVRQRPASFEPGDPARVPSRLLGWLSVLAVVLVLLGLFFFARTFFAPAAELPSLVEQQQAEQRAAAQAAQRQRAPGARQAPAQPAGPVVFTAVEDAWVRFYTPQGTLSERVMRQGETYTVPTDAQQPMIRTGRPDALTITVGGRPVPKLSEEMRTMSDVPVTGEAILARAQPASTAAGRAAASPNPGAAPAVRPSPTT
jgi:cytoskeletal protein RodZ